MKVALFRRGHFNAAHQLVVPSWSLEKNLEVFGKCANPNFHGHNYEIEVKVSGEVDPETGILINLVDLKNLIRVEIEEHLDHKNLNLDVRDFDDLIPTVEHIVYVCYKRLRAKLDDKYDLKVRLYETPRNYAEYPVD